LICYKKERLSAEKKSLGAFAADNLDGGGKGTAAVFYACKGVS
jgi:hypothetical protein